MLIEKNCIVYGSFIVFCNRKINYFLLILEFDFFEYAEGLRNVPENFTDCHGFTDDCYCVALFDFLEKNKILKWGI